VIDVVPLANWWASSAVADAAVVVAGDAWPAGDPVVLERHTVTIPSDWPLDTTRLHLDTGGTGQVLLHSRLGRERHPVGPDTAWVPVPTRAFGIRVEAYRTPPAGAVTAAAPRLGATRLVRLDPGWLAMKARLDTEVCAIDAALAASDDLPLIETRLAAIESAVGAAIASAPAAARAG
jgi:hypothetical protein